MAGRRLRVAAPLSEAGFRALVVLENGWVTSLDRGGVVGAYTIQERIGSGAFGDTYLARDRHGARVAVKVLKQQHRGDGEVLERFTRELRAGQALESQLFARVLDWDLDAGEPWLCFSGIEGRGLGESIREGPVPFDRVHRIAGQLVAALQALAAASCPRYEESPWCYYRCQGFSRVKSRGALGIRRPHYGRSQRDNLRRERRWRGPRP